MEQFYKKARVPLRMAYSTGSQAVMCKGCEITNSDVELSSNMFGILDNTGDVKISDTHSEIGGDFSGIYSYGKVSITNGDTYIDAGTYGICADDSIIVDWTTDKKQGYTARTTRVRVENLFSAIALDCCRIQLLLLPRMLTTRYCVLHICFISPRRMPPHTMKDTTMCRCQEPWWQAL